MTSYLIFFLLYYIVSRLTQLELGYQQIATSIILGVLGLVVAIWVFVRQYQLSLKQIKIIKKQIRLGAIQTEINGLTNEMIRLEQQWSDAHNSFLSISLNMETKDRAKFYDKGLKSIEHFKSSSNKIRNKINKQYKLYNNEVYKT